METLQRDLTDAALAASLGNFTSRTVNLDGLDLHYVEGGQGPLVLLLPGWPQTWWEFRKVMPALVEDGSRVVAVDLPGMGGSGKPNTGFDKRSMAHVIAGLVRHLGDEPANVVGHDIGAQVAFAMAANNPQVVRKVVLLDVVHPDRSLYELRMLPLPDVPFFPWWFAFNQVTGLPEVLLEGRAHALIDWVFDSYLMDPANVTAFDREVFATAYDSPDAIRCSNAWYQAFGQDIADLETYAPISHPVLGMVSGLGGGMFAAGMRALLAERATNATVVDVPDSGHYFVEEQADVVASSIVEFLNA